MPRNGDFRTWANWLPVNFGESPLEISVIHLLKTFINADNLKTKLIVWQVVIHATFVLSAIALAWIDRLTFRSVETKH